MSRSGPRSSKFDARWTQNILEAFRFHIVKTESLDRFLTIRDKYSGTYLVAATKTENDQYGRRFIILQPGTTEQDFINWMYSVPTDLNPTESRTWAINNHPDLQSVGGIDMYELNDNYDYVKKQWLDHLGYFVSAAAIQHGYRGRRLMKNLYTAIACEMFPFYSDRSVTTGARRVWKSLKNDWDVRVETRDDRFYIECKHA